MSNTLKWQMPTKTTNSTKNNPLSRFSLDPSTTVSGGLNGTSIPNPGQITPSNQYTAPQNLPHYDLSGSSGGLGGGLNIGQDSSNNNLLNSSLGFGAEAGSGLNTNNPSVLNAQKSMFDAQKALYEKQAAAMPSADAVKYQGWANMGAAAGNLVLGYMNYRENKKNSKLQRAALRQDMEIIKENRANRQARNESWGRVFGGDD